MTSWGRTVHRLVPSFSEVRSHECAPLCLTVTQDRSRGLDGSAEVARLIVVQVVLRKLGRGSRAVSGRLVRAPRKGSVVVIEFSDGMHEYVTTPVKRVLRLAAKDVFYIETVNSRYRLEVRDRERTLEDASSG